MSKKRYKIIFVSSFAVGALFLVFFQIQKNILIPNKVAAERNKSNLAGIVFTLKIGDAIYHPTYHAGQSLYDALLLAKENKQIAFSGKNYPALGFFVTDIGSLHSGNGKYLFYYINNKEASVGVSSYLLKNGDIVEWKLK